MKKFLALALCALFVIGVVASVSATDYALDYNFNDDTEGDFIAIDNSIKMFPKQFSIQVVKFDGAMCAKFDHTGYTADGRNGSKDKDCFADILIGGTNTTYGLKDKFVVSYDIYFEKLTTSEASKSQWQCAMLRMSAPAGTQFQQSCQVIGDQLIPTNGDSTASVMTIKTGKWYNFAALYDVNNKTISFYVDGVLVVDETDWTVADTSATEGTQMRLAWGVSTGDASADGVAYVDNIKAYNADKPENATGAVATTAVPATAAPETTAAPATTTAAATAAQTSATAGTGSSTATADIAVVIAAVAAVAAAGAVVIKKKH